MISSQAMVGDNTSLTEPSLDAICIAMHRTTILLDTRVKAKAQIRAERLGISLSQLIRNSLEKEVSIEPASQLDPFWADHEIIEDEGPVDYAENHDYYLYRTEG